MAVAAADYDELIATVHALLPRVKELRAANRSQGLSGPTLL